MSLILCLAIAGCIKTSAPDNANTTTSTASDSSGSGDQTGPSAAEQQAALTDRSAETSHTDQNPDQMARKEPVPVSNANDQPTQSNDTQSNDDVLDISFEDIKLPIQEDMVFRPFMLTDRVKELDGKRIRISGYMLPDTRTKGIKQFVLLKNTECKFGPGGQADHLLNVLMVEGQDARFRSEPISIEGRLTVKPFQGPDGNTWSIYDVACDRVTRYRPRR